MSAIRFIQSLLLIGHVSCSFDYTAPLSGKFFYAQMQYDDTKGLYIPVTIGSGENKNITQNWHITTNEHMMGIFDATCMQSGLGCTNSNDPGSEEGLVNDTITDGHRLPGTINEPASFPDSQQLFDNFQLIGQRMWNKYNFTLDTYKRETILDDSTSFIIQQVTQENGKKIDFANGITGYLGIQPYTSNLQQKENSFLYQLKHTAQFIDHVCISFYRSPNKDGLSLIKFGSYDKHGLEDNQDPKIFKTSGIDGWILDTKSASVDSTLLFNAENGDERKVQINPQFQYTYIPQADFKAFKTYIRDNYDTVQCLEESNACYFPQACSAVPDQSFTLSVTVTDNTGEKDSIKASWKDLKVDGSIFGIDDTCYFGVFSNSDSSENLKSTWVVGNNMMAQKYYFLDMGPFIEEEKAYFAIGMGPINPVDIIGETHYDYKSNNFMPELKTNDMSQQISGQNPYETDQYEPGHEKRVQFNAIEDEPWYEKNKTLIIILPIMAVIVFITLVMVVVYYFKNKKYKFEQDEDHGLVNRLPSVNMPAAENAQQRLLSINSVKFNRYPSSEDISLDEQNFKQQRQNDRYPSSESLDQDFNQNKLDTTPNQYI